MKANTSKEEAYVREWLSENSIDERTLYLAVPTNSDGEVCDPEDKDASQDPWLGTCDISGQTGMIYRCMALTKDGEQVEFDAGEWLIGGELGRVAGCF